MSAMSVPLSAARSSRCYQSALLRASRETCQPKTIPTCPSATSLVSVAKASRPAVLVPDWPKSPSNTVTRAGCQPRASARSTNARWFVWLSWCSRTCLGLDWRTYTTARRSRCVVVIFAMPSTLSLRSTASGVRGVLVVMADLRFVLSRARPPIRRAPEETLLTHRHQPPEHLLLLAWGQRLPHLARTDALGLEGRDRRWPGRWRLAPAHDSLLLFLPGPGGCSG